MSRGGTSARDLADNVGMRLPGLLLISILTLLPAGARAQSLQPYIVGEGGGWFGDGGSTGAVAAGFGVLTPQNFGFEIELSYLPGLDFGDPGDPRIAIFPPIGLEVTGRVVALQTHVVGVLPGGGNRLRAVVLAGGGIADVERRIRISRGFVPPIFTPGLLDVPVLLPPSDFEARQSETALVLSAGTGLEYRVTSKVGLGVSLRYQRVFSDPTDIDGARVAARVTWRF